MAEGWTVTAPDRAWPMVAARDCGLDVANLGYAGAARGEIPSAEEISDLDADLITISHGTNCWTRIPHSTDLFAAGLAAFLAIVRQGHPDTPIVAISPIVRPDAEATENRLGATLADLRAVFEQTVAQLIAAGDRHLRLIKGLPIVAPELLDDDIHPGDAGHAALAAAIGPALGEVLAGPGS